MRAERLPDPTEYVGPILDAVKKEYVVKTYGIKEWEVRCCAGCCVVRGVRVVALLRCGVV